MVALTHKTVSDPPYFEELAHSFDAADPLIHLVAPAAQAAIRALGITSGIAHVEMRLVDGRPRLVEVNGRIAGDMIGHLVHLATGIDLPRAAANIACDRAPDLTPTRYLGRRDPAHLPGNLRHSAPPRLRRPSSRSHH